MRRNMMSRSDADYVAINGGLSAHHIEKRREAFYDNKAIRHFRKSEIFHYLSAVETWHHTLPSISAYLAAQQKS